MASSFPARFLVIAADSFGGVLADRVLQLFFASSSLMCRWVAGEPIDRKASALQNLLTLAQSDRIARDSVCQELDHLSEAALQSADLRHRRQTCVLVKQKYHKRLLV